MRYRSSSSTNFGPNTPENLYAKSQCALWLSRLTESNYIVFNDDFFICLEWAANGLQRTMRKLSEAVADIPDTERGAQTVKKDMRCAMRERRAHMNDILESLAEEHPAVRQVLPDIVREECRRAVNRGEKYTVFAQGRKRLRKLFGVSKDFADLCDYLFLLGAFPQVADYFNDSLRLGRCGGWRILSVMLGIKESSLKQCLHQAQLYGFLQQNSLADPALKEEIAALWTSDKAEKSIGQLFCRPLEGKTLPLDRYTIPKDDVNHVIKLLSSKESDPVNILLYGEPGTGKTSFAKSLAAKLDVRAWSVPSKDEDDDDDRRASLSACLHVASKHKGSVVLVDEAERLLDTGGVIGKNYKIFHADKHCKDKAWLNSFMEEPGRRVIWISNDVRHIDPAVRRRFSYSIHFDRLGLRQRMEIWRQILEDHGALRRLQQSDIEHFAQEYDVAAAVVEKAVLQAKNLHSGKKGFAETIELVLHAHVTLEQDGFAPERKPRAEIEYTLEGVCLETKADGGGQGQAAEDFMETCRAIDAAWRQGDLRPSSGNMLFYGPPGTGKTALARYMAKELDRECVVKKASDLLSKYVGESEQMVAAMFRQAQRDGSILVIDEADSFIYSREGAVRSWETSLVNEFLTGLEEFRGMCICTTNRRSDMDAAAMRRFAAKIGFTYAGPEQVSVLYDKLLSQWAKAPLSSEEKKALRHMNRLAPGDFNVVRSRCWFRKPGSMNAADLIEALRLEMQTKLDSRPKKVGF
jgi:AAA+ superfamily predicted ATPase